MLQGSWRCCTEEALRERFAEAENFPADWQHHHVTPAGTLTSLGSMRACVMPRRKEGEEEFSLLQVIRISVSIPRCQDCPTEWVAVGREYGMAESWRWNLLFIERSGFFFLFLLLEKVADAKPALLLTQSCRRLSQVKEVGRIYNLSVYWKQIEYCAGQQINSEQAQSGRISCWVAFLNP